MLSLDTILGMVATEAIEHPREQPYRVEQVQHTKPAALPAVQYNLELVSKPDGTYKWEE